MTNFYKTLDSHFPCSADRVCGEVVAVAVRIVRQIPEIVSTGVKSLENLEIGVVQHKRKAWYKNASVNAFHLHRQLCKELSVLIARDGFRFTKRTEKAIKRQLFDAVWNAYVANKIGDHQYSLWTIVAPSAYGSRSVREAARKLELNEVPVLYLNNLDDYVTGAFQKMTGLWSFGTTDEQDLESLAENTPKGYDEPKWELVPFQFISIG